jgi:RNase P subunit RPR2
MERLEVIEKAREKYISTGVTLNITEALRMYLENDATDEEQIPLTITAPVNNKIKEELKTVRPTCDECDGYLFMQTNAMDFITGNKYPTAWVCNTCNKIEYSDKTPEQWLEILRNENRQ